MVMVGVDDPLYGQTHCQSRLASSEGW